jgi:hypothetical protein
LANHERKAAEKEFLKTADINVRTAMDIFPGLPHSAQCTIKGDNFSLWSSLTTEGMVGAVSDLSLKHGTEIPGVWHLLGVLDALPDPIAPQIPASTITGEPQHFENTIRNFSNLARTTLGRAPEAYGATTLLLFRKVSTIGDN